MRKLMAFIILIILGIALYFTTGKYFDNSNNEESFESNIIKKEKILPMAKEDYYNLLSKIRELQKTPDQIMKFNCMIMELMYNGKIEENDIEILAKLQREYYNSHLLNDNPEFVHIERLKEEINEYNKNGIKIIGYDTVAPEYIGSKDRAIIKVVFYLNNTGEGADVYEQYYLQQSEAGLWNIVGWSSIEEFTVTE